MFWYTGPQPAVPDYERCWADTATEFVVPGETAKRRQECFDAAVTPIGLCAAHHREITGSAPADMPQAELTPA